LIRQAEAGSIKPSRGRCPAMLLPVKGTRQARWTSEGRSVYESEVLMIDGTSRPLADPYRAISRRLIPAIPPRDVLSSRRGDEGKYEGRQAHARNHRLGFLAHREGSKSAKGIEAMKKSREV